MIKKTMEDVDDRDDNDVTDLLQISSSYHRGFVFDRDGGGIGRPSHKVLFPDHREKGSLMVAV